VRFGRGHFGREVDHGQGVAEGAGRPGQQQGRTRAERLTVIRESFDGGKYVVQTNLDDGAAVAGDGPVVGAALFFRALRHGKDWRDLMGDKLVLEMLLEVQRLRTFAADARELLEQIEWLVDEGRQCVWCGAARDVFDKEGDIGTPRERLARDNHAGARSDDARRACPWLALYRAAEPRK
jgi:hypothetical protein